MFQHDASGGLFTNYADVGSQNPQEPDSKLFSILNQLEDYRNIEGKFQFKLCYPDLTWGRDGKTCNEWRQSSNPFTDSTITDFEAISLAFVKDCYNEDWKGLGKNSGGNDQEAVIDDAPSKDLWCSAIGVKSSLFGDGKFPGPNDPTNLENSITSKVELYVLATENSSTTNGKNIKYIFLEMFYSIQVITIIMTYLLLLKVA